MVLLFWQWAYFSLKNHYNGLREAHYEVSHLRLKMQKAVVRTEVVQYQFNLFKQQIAKVIPELEDHSSPEMQSQKRGLASIVQQPSEEFLAVAQVEASIDDLRNLFDQRKYKQVIRKAKNILSLNPMSPNLISIYFMLAESYYQNNEIEACLSIAQQMTQLFPDQEKTGYVLLRVGLLLKEKNRIEEARNMFSLVSHAFPDEKILKVQSEKLMASLGGTE